MRNCTLPMDEEEADERLLNVVKHYVLEREMPIYIAKTDTNKNSGDRIIFTTQYNNIINDVIKTDTHKKCLYCSKSNLIFNKMCLKCDNMF